MIRNVHNFSLFFPPIFFQEAYLAFHFSIFFVVLNEVYFYFLMFLLNVQVIKTSDMFECVKLLNTGKERVSARCHDTEGRLLWGND